MKKRKTRQACPVWGGVPAGYGRSRLAFPVGYSFLNDGAQNGFMRGFIAAGLVAATASEGIEKRETLRLALQGGTALATGIAGANALDRGDYGSALLALAAGAAGLKAINYALAETTQFDEGNHAHEQEKA